MNQKVKASVLTGLNLAVTAILASGAHAATVHQHGTSDQDVAQGNKSGVASQAHPQAFEASFLKVSPLCKVSNAAFEAVKVAIQDVPVEIRQIHAEIEVA